MKLRVVGRLDDELIKKYEKVLECHNSKKKLQIILFCDFSEFNIPIGHNFKTIENMKGETIFISDIILKKVSQQFILPFDFVPHGWETICKFQLLEKSIEKLLEQLPTIKDWSESSVFFILK